MAPFTPFIAEYLYREVGGKLESVHLDKWPEAKKVDQEIIDAMASLQEISTVGQALRAEAGIKIRQPLQGIKFVGGQVCRQFKEDKASFIDIIKDELNIKEFALIESLDEIVDKEFWVTKSTDKISVALNIEITDELKTEGVLRELIRTINGMRKDAGLTIKDQIKIVWQSDGDVVKKVFIDSALKEELMKSTITEDVEEVENNAKAVNINGEKVKLQVEKI
jgi:isoleucyl-tRNA synthetase